ncbi:hypothetical protein [Comamonas sp.]|uniref:hypothetical protein n=1 Tax=Comamonas sp. TaxID=34028 RepID=UPI0028AD1EA0|nr:hypothetical protein [Comamonas sp.]
MKLIHAHRRSAPIEVELFGEVIQFQPDARGRMVAEVEDGPVAARLLQIKEAYVLLKDLDAEAQAQAQAQADAQAKEAAEAKARALAQAEADAAAKEQAAEAEKAKADAEAAAAQKAQAEADASKPAAGRKKAA